MRHAYLIARREYLSYVATWGFWLSLALVPVFMIVGLLIPTLVESASPTRYYTVIANQPELVEAIDARVRDGRVEDARAAVAAMARMRGGGEAAESRVLAAFDAADGGLNEKLAAAVEAAGLGVAARSINLPDSKFVRVAPPAADADALRPYLIGERLIDTDDGPQELFAAVFLDRDDSGRIAIDYWSTQTTNTEILGLVRGAMRDQMRTAALAAAGVSPEMRDRIERLEPKVTQLNAERAGASAEVTLADKLPLMLGVMGGIGLWIVIFSVVNMLLTSVIEEKSTKVLETLLATARLEAILAGKLFGVAAVSFTLLAVWGGVGLVGLTFAAQAGLGVPADLVAAIADPGLLIPFLFYFVTGYLMYGAIFLAIGSLCETIHEAQTLMTPMIFLLMGPMLVLPVAVRNPDAGVIAALSWFPLYTPFLMMLRLPADPSVWTLVGTSILLIASTLAVVWAAGGVFRAGVVGRAGPDAVKRAFGRVFRGRGKPASSG